MRLLLALFLLFAMYHCASPQGDSSYFELRNGMQMNQHNGKTVKIIRMVGDRHLTVFFTDGSTMKLETVKYHLRLLQ